MKTIYKSGNVEQIVSEVAAELSQCSFVIFCSDYDRFEEFSKKLHNALPNAKMIGTTGYMFSPTDGFDMGLSAIGFTDDDAEVYVGTLRRIDTCPIKYVPGLIWSAQVITEKYKNNICFEFTTGHEEKVVSTMKVSLEPVGMGLVGGTAGNVPPGEEKKVSCNGKVLTNCAVFAVIGSKIGKVKIFKENLFHTRKQTHIVTKVSEDKRSVLEIDGIKAMDLYERENNYTDANVHDGVFNHPICRVVGSENYISAIFSFNKEDRSITLYKNCQVNDMISFTDIDEDFEGYIRNNMYDIKNNSNVEAIVSVNCILRYLFFEKKNYKKEYASTMYDTANKNHFGMVSDGEQYIEQHINQSMVSVIFTRDK